MRCSQMSGRRSISPKTKLHCTHVHTYLENPSPKRVVIHEAIPVESTYTRVHEHRPMESTYTATRLPPKHVHTPNVECILERSDNQYSSNIQKNKTVYTKKNISNIYNDYYHKTATAGKSRSPNNRTTNDFTEKSIMEVNVSQDSARRTVKNLQNTASIYDKSQFEDLEKTLRDQDRIVTSMQRDINVKNNKIKELTVKVDYCKKEHGDFYNEIKIENAKSREEVVKEQPVGQSLEIYSLKEKIILLEDENKKLAQNLAKMTKGNENQTLKKDTEKLVENLKDQLRTKNERLLHLEHLKIENEQEIRCLKIENSSLNNQLTTCREGGTSSCRECYKDQSCHLTDMKCEIDKKDHKIIELSNEIRMLATENERLLIERNSLQSNFHKKDYELEYDLKSIIVENDSLKDKVKILEHKEDQTRISANDIENKIAGAMSHKIKLVMHESDRLVKILNQKNDELDH